MFKVGMEVSNSGSEEMRKLVVSIVVDQEVFLDDWEFETVFGSTNLDYLKLLNDYMTGNQPLKTREEYMLRNAIVLIYGYPHQKQGYIKERYELDIKEISDKQLLQSCGYTP